MRIRVYFDVEINRQDLPGFHASVQDALADVFMEEGVMPKDGVKVQEVTCDEADE